MPQNGLGRDAGWYLLRTDSSVEQIGTGYGVANGLDWSEDGRLLYTVDTARRAVFCCRYELEQGRMAHLRHAVTVEEGLPDGIAMDAEGMLWIAQWGASKVGRYNPQSGRLLAQVALPVPLVSGVAFGGASLDEMYITTAVSTLAPQPGEGLLYCVRVDVPGRAVFRLML